MRLAQHSTAGLAMLLAAGACAVPACADQAEAMATPGVLAQLAWVDWGHLGTLLAMLTVLAFFFAKVEIQIEGPAGWAANLPTWRIERHVLLDLFAGGRVLTGYHAWVFTFMLLIFHFPVILLGCWSWRIECRILGSVMLFWVMEDFLWFVLNPAYGMSGFTRTRAWWHKHWLLGAPADYWVWGLTGVAFVGRSYL